MDFLTKLWHYITGTSNKPSPNKKVQTKNQGKGKSIMPKSQPQQPKPKEIQYINEPTDEQLIAKQKRERHFTQVPNPDYKIKKGDSIDKIAKKFGVSGRIIKELNGIINEKSLKIGRVIKIPPTQKIKNVNNLNDIAETLGVSKDFIVRIKRLEDGNLADNKFHNEPYKDKNGVQTIGIGHLLKKGDKRKLTDKEVCELFTNDMLKVEDTIIGIIGKGVYDKLPHSMKEALLDMVFNKGETIIKESEGLTYCLKEGKYESAINKMTYNKANKTGQEMSGLSKRRLFDISLAIKIYKNGIPQSNINTAQNVYNRGVELLRKECKEKKYNFSKVLAGYNQEVQSYFKGKINLKYITK